MTGSSMMGHPHQAWPRVDVLIMAAGSGSRMRSTERKQWMTLCGHPLLVFTAARFVSFGATSVVVVVHPDDIARANAALEVAAVPFCRVVAGGTDRQGSVWCGLTQGSREYVAVHDAARPFVTLADVERVLDQALLSGAATLGHPSRDTLKFTQDADESGVMLDRQRVWQVQTPQVFRRDWLLRGHEWAQSQSFHGTDDTALVEQAGFSVPIVRGSAWNVKVTEPEDVDYLRMWEAFECGLA